jgi:hypothetical protein
MSNVTHLRMRAQSCLRLSDQNHDPEMKACLVSIAQTYLATALALRSSETAVSSKDGATRGPWFREQGGAPPATEEVAMRQQAGRADAPTTPTHPRCPDCAVPMWLVLVNYPGHDEQRHFECKVCDARTLLPKAGK